MFIFLVIERHKAIELVSITTAMLSHFSFILVVASVPKNSLNGAGLGLSLKILPLKPMIVSLGTK